VAIRGLRSRSSFARSSRRKSSWGFGPATSTDGESQSLSASAAILAGQAVSILADGQTLVRTRGDFNIFLQTAGTQADGFSGAFGIGVATTAAITAGVASVPTPITEETWDGWLYHRYFSVICAEPIAVATTSKIGAQVHDVAAALRFEVDSKAMRKLTQDQTIYAVIEVIEIGVATARWAFNSRMLFKLP